MGDNRRALSIAIGISKGFNQASQNLINVMQSKEKLNQSRELFDLKKKQTDLKIKELELTSSPEMVEYAKTKAKSETGLAEAKFKIFDSVLKQREKEHIEKRDVFGKAGIDLSQSMQQTQSPGEQIPPAQSPGGGAPSPFIQLNEGINMNTGLPNVKTVKNPKYSLWEAKQKATIKSDIKQEEIETEANQSFKIIAGSAKGLMQYYADSVKEGGAGNIVKAKASDFALSVGGSFGDRYSTTAGFVGQRGELALKMMPLLTGSVRIVESIFRYLTRSLPDKNDGPKTAKSKMEQTIKNMYGFSKAMEKNNIPPGAFDNMSEKEANKLGSKITTEAMAYKLTDQDKEELKTILEDITSPVNELISSGESKKSFIVDGFTYDIPKDDVDEFLQQYPTAKEV